MRKGGGHGKGSEFERNIAKQIVKAFKHKKIKQKECWRSVMSGGHVMSSGDLRFSRRLEKLFPFSVECKHYKKIRWENFLLRKKSNETSWLDQAEEGASKEMGLSAILVIKANNYPVMVIYHPPSTTVRIPRFIDRKGRWWAVMKWTKFLKLKAEAQ